MAVGINGEPTQGTKRTTSLHQEPCSFRKGSCLRATYGPTSGETSSFSFRNGFLDREYQAIALVVVANTKGPDEKVDLEGRAKKGCCGNRRGGSQGQIGQNPFEIIRKCSYLLLFAAQREGSRWVSCLEEEHPFTRLAHSAASEVRAVE